MFTVTRCEQIMLFTFLADFAMKLGFIQDCRNFTGILFSVLGVYGFITCKIRNGSNLALLLYWICFAIRYLNLAGFCERKEFSSTVDESSGITEKVYNKCTMSIADSSQGGIITYFISWIIFVLYMMMFFCMLRMNAYWYIYPNGIYGVGHSETIFTDDDYSVTVSCFYPIDKVQYMKDLNDESKYVKWNIDGDKFLHGLGIARGMDKIFLRDLNTYQLLAVNNAKIHPNFDGNDKKLTPVIFSHGLTAGRTTYSSIVYNLVSYGCIVYTFNHTDTSAAYCCDYSKVPPEDKFYIPYSQIVDQCRQRNEEVKITEQHFCHNKLQKRMIDIKRMIDLIKDDAKNKYPAIDMSKLVMMGHSMGGITSIEASNRYENDIKLCCAIDPYYFPIHDYIEEMDDYALKQPILIVNSEKFHQSQKTYNNLKVNELFFARTEKLNNSKKNYNVIIKNTDHHNQVDVVLFNSLVLTIMGTATNCDYQAKYMELIGTILAFLDEHDYLPIKTYMKVDDIIKN